MLPFFGTAPTPSEAAEAAAGAVNFLRADTLPHDAYRLTIAPERIDIVSGGPQGAFYAVQTLRQLLPQKAAGTAKIRAVELPAATIDDRPALAYRGLMLDVARHFFTVEEVKRTLDLLALHKMNVFHWHLTDDQGWRIEIERYPELTRTGAVRRRTLIGRDPGGEYDATCRYDETPYGGYYTQEEIREVVDYAARRFITVIPEIEFPGHAVAALASYPWLSCTGERYEVRQTWDIDDRVFCPGRETTFEFIEHVLEEVIGLFPRNTSTSAATSARRPCGNAAPAAGHGCAPKDSTRPGSCRAMPRRAWSSFCNATAAGSSAGTSCSKAAYRPRPSSCRGAEPKAASGPRNRATGSSWRRRRTVIWTITSRPTRPPNRSPGADSCRSKRFTPSIRWRG